MVLSHRFIHAFPAHVCKRLCQARTIWASQRLADRIMLATMLLTLGFLQATPSGQLGWAGLDALSLSSDNEQARAIRTEIEALRASGGDVMG